MLIVDAQVHLWGQGNPLAHHRQVSSYSVDELLQEMDEGGVDAAIIHPPGWDTDSGALALAAASAYPDRLSILGKIPVNDPSVAGSLQVGYLNLECSASGLLSSSQDRNCGL